jgi:hypothetical protein
VKESTLGGEGIDTDEEELKAAEYDISLKPIEWKAGTREEKLSFAEEEARRKEEIKEEFYTPKTAMEAFLRENPDATPEERAAYAQRLKSKGIRILPDGTVEIGGAGQNEIGTKSMVEMNKAMAKSVIEQRTNAQGAAASLKAIYEAEAMLDSGMITGFGAEFLTGLGNFLASRLGFKEYEDPVANAQAYASVMGSQVGQIIKQFGAGTGLSDADREYAEKMAGGKITLNEEALRKIININKEAHANVLANYNKMAQEIMKKPGAKNLLYDLSIDIPKATNDPLGIRR